MNTFPETLNIEDIVVEDRMRSDYGDLESMIISIKEHGLIQPMVLGDDYSDDSGPRPRLIAGGRRYAALRKMGVKELKEGYHWVRRDENNSSPEKLMRLQAIELEENLRRKNLTWQEEVLGKKMLLETMQKLHGVRGSGPPSRFEKATGIKEGFGVNRLAEMLGESPANVSRDLQTAKAITLVPMLRMESSKASASQKATAIVIKQLIQSGAVKAPPQMTRELSYRLLVYCESEKQQLELMEEFTKRGLKCQPVIV